VHNPLGDPQPLFPEAPAFGELAPHKEDYVRDTVAALKDTNPDCIIPMHCTGETFIDIVQKEMPDKFIRSYTGSRDIFGA
jgi:7,8-dihydropterin-6-yl-methyl-4-(beta-D-ribofuranosyl)aminobenzene 5'-phosphate synthase